MGNTGTRRSRPKNWHSWKRNALRSSISAPASTGDLPLTPDAIAVLGRYAPVVRPTPDILPLLEQERRKYAAVLHVTC